MAMGIRGCAEMSDALRQAFIEDHRILIQGLSDIRQSLAGDDLAAAVAAAGRLDRDVGPHIEFEERAFYPELRELLGSDFVHQLYREHTTGQKAIAEILGLGSAHELAPDRRDALVAQLDATLEHALSCGTLLSHIETLEASRRDQLMEQLQESRERSRKWTELRSKDQTEGA